MQSRNIVDLVDQGLITFFITVGSLNALDLQVENNSAEPLRMTIRSATFFDNSDTSSKNMVVLDTFTALLQSHGQGDFNLDVTCANLHLTKPSQADTCLMKRVTTPLEMVKVIDELNSSTVDHAVEQAAIWNVTDDATFDQLGIQAEGSRFGPSMKMIPCRR
jgi:hypothetical protein